MPPKSLLDTDILSDLMRPPSNSAVNALAYEKEYGRFTFSIITRYEILRGLKAKQATAQLAAFELACKYSEILPLDDRTIVRAADIFADLKRRGELIGDADILIAATALENALVMVTNNIKHFSKITGLKLSNWSNP